MDRVAILVYRVARIWSGDFLASREFIVAPRCMLFSEYRVAMGQGRVATWLLFYKKEKKNLYRFRVESFQF